MLPTVMHQSRTVAANVLVLCGSITSKKLSMEEVIFRTIKAGLCWGSKVGLLKRPSYPRISKNISKMALDLEVNRIVWIDLEMTGLDINSDTIMEIACVVTDTDLNIVAEAPNLVIKTPEEKLQQMNEWCINQHGKTGLTEASRTSNVTPEQAEEQILTFVKEHVAEKVSPLAGNSVYMDRLFLQKHMPDLNDYLHYRIIDVSTVKELCRRWNKEAYRAAPEKKFSHRALTDIRESIAELKFYKINFFKTGY